MNPEQSTHNIKDISLHAVAKIRAEEIIRLQTWRSNEQQKNMSLNSAALPMLAVKRSLADVFAQREGLHNSNANEKDIQVATNLLADLIAAVAANATFTSREIVNEFEYGRQLTAGELWITQFKQKGFAINFIDPSPSAANTNNLLVLGLEAWSIVNFEHGKAKSKSFTGPWSGLRDSENAPLVAGAGGVPKSVPEVVAIYEKLARTKNTRSGVKYVVLHARTSSGDREKIALVTVEEMSSRNILDVTIHKGRHARLNEIAAHTSNVPQQLKVGRLRDKELKIVREATERAKRIVDFSNPSELASLLEILMQIEEFKHMSAGEQAYVLTEWFDAIWLGTGDLGEKNPIGVGFNGRPLA